MQIQRGGTGIIVPTSTVGLGLLEGVIRLYSFCELLDLGLSHVVVDLRTLRRNFIIFDF
jgi:hypothetical protein